MPTRARWNGIAKGLESWCRSHQVERVASLTGALEVAEGMKTVCSQQMRLHSIGPSFLIETNALSCRNP